MTKPRIATPNDQFAPPAFAPLLKVDEVASVLRLSVRQVRRMIAGGELPVIRLGRAVRVSTAALEDILICM